MKKMLARIVLVAIALFLLIVIAKAVNGEEFVEKKDPLSLGNIQELGTDPASIINLLEQDKRKCLVFSESIITLWLNEILSEEAFVETFSKTMDNLSVIDYLLEEYQLNYPALFEIEKPKFSETYL